MYLAVLIILSALLGLAGAILVNLNKKSGAYLLTSAAFNKINIGINIDAKNYYHGRTIPAMINTAREIAEDINSGEMKKQQVD